jgi:hypothetical protein
MSKPSWQIYDLTGMIFSSVDTNIQYLFPSIGTYTVALHADNGHLDSIIKIMNVDTIIKADFGFQQCSQRFTNMSACAKNFYWDFGDGSYSSSPMPVHQYADTGSYTVKLIATNGIASDSLIKNIHVDTQGFPTANFSFVQSNDTVYFQSDSTINYHSWDFGDLAASNDISPMHVYADTGDYVVILIEANICSMAWQSKLVHITLPAYVLTVSSPGLSVQVQPNPVSDFQEMNFYVYSPINSDSKISIYNLLGTKLLEKQKILIHGMNTGTMVISGIKAGTYFLRVDAQSAGTTYKKITIINN